MWVAVWLLPIFVNNGYPNPTAGSIFYDLKVDDSYSYTISDVTGRVLETGIINSANNQLNLSIIITYKRIELYYNNETEITDSIFSLPYLLFYFL
jgi:hypothetical protein